MIGIGIKASSRRKKVISLPLTLVGDSVADGAPDSTLVGLLVGGSGFYTLTDSAGGRFRLEGNQLVATGLALPASQYTIIVASGGESKSFDITVTPPSLAQVAGLLGNKLLVLYDPTRDLDAVDWVDSESGIAALFSGTPQLNAAGVDGINNPSVTFSGDDRCGTSVTGSMSGILPAGANPSRIFGVAAKSDTGETTNQTLFAYGGSASGSYRRVGSQVVSSNRRLNASIGSAVAVDTNQVFGLTPLRYQARFHTDGGTGFAAVSISVNDSAFITTVGAAALNTATGANTSLQLGSATTTSGGITTQLLLGTLGPQMVTTDSVSAEDVRIINRALAGYIAGASQTPTNYPTIGGGIGLVFPTGIIWPELGIFGVA